MQRPRHRCKIRRQYHVNRIRASLPRSPYLAAYCASHAHLPSKISPNAHSAILVTKSSSRNPASNPSLVDVTYCLSNSPQPSAFLLHFPTPDFLTFSPCRRPAQIVHPSEKKKWHLCLRSSERHFPHRISAIAPPHPTSLVRHLSKDHAW